MARRTTTPEFLATLEQHALLFTDGDGSFPNETYRARMPQLIRETAEHNKQRFTADEYDGLVQLAHELSTNARVRLPSEYADAALSPMTAHWKALLDDKHYTWHNAPWFLTEQYLFQCVLLVSGYYRTHIDPFHPSKRLELQERAPWRLLQSAVAISATDTSERTRHRHLCDFLKLCLWGNKADGCYTVVKDTISGDNATLAVDDKFLLADDSDAVATHLEQLAVRIAGGDAAAPTSVQFINDNCGTELLLDLALADHLLTHGVCASVTFNVKAEPIYVSDATPPDVLEHIAAMQDPMHPREIQDLGVRLANYVASRKVVIESDLFWSHYSFYYELPEALAARLHANAALVIVKGDLNYRRLLGDRMWPATTPVAAAIPYFPAPVVALRTLKANPIVGIAAETEQRLDRDDPHWRYNGVYGVIQCVL